MRKLAFVLAVLLAAPAGAAWITSPLLFKAYDGATTVPGLSPCNSKRIGVHTTVTDALDATHCEAGGTTLMECRCNGTAWVATGLTVAAAAEGLTTACSQYAWPVSDGDTSMSCSSNAPTATLATTATTATGVSLLASPPYTCDGTKEGKLYSDTSHAACWCDGSTWTKLGGAGTCE